MYDEMLESLRLSQLRRLSSDTASPMQQLTVEAVGCSYVLRDAFRNLFECDERWAKANVLHFFTATERAEPLLALNKHASKFLDNGFLRGAYGPIVVPQLWRCIEKLRDAPSSRRAIVSTGELEHDDINRPPCISFMHFLAVSGQLDLHAYQRSLNLAVAPYDLVLLTNILNFVAVECEMQLGHLHWHIGSLHATDLREREQRGSLLLPPELLRVPAACWYVLEQEAAVAKGAP